MLGKLKTLILRRPSEEPPLIRLMKLILRECVAAGAHTVVFGRPPEGLPTEPLPHGPATKDREPGADPSGRWRQGRMPVWFNTGHAWKEVERIPHRLFAEFLTTLADHSSTPGDARPLSISHVDAGEHEGVKKCVQYEFCIEENFHFSIHILGVVEGSSYPVRPARPVGWLGILRWNVTGQLEKGEME